MHIPDGYLSPVVSLGLGTVTLPVWAVAADRVKRVLNNRTVPLLAVFSALSFTVMLFNIPVVGGTTAHAVGGTLIAVVLGPWAAIIAVTTAVVIQALFFGDGGVLAIFANCLNMAILLPFTGYLTYRLLAGRSSRLSTRTAVAAAIGSYVGLTVGALAVGIELGIEPMLFSDHGRPLYSAYTLDQAVPALLISHMFGASIVEAAVTGLGIAYLQRRHPEYLTRAIGGTAAGDEAAGESADVSAGERRQRPLWQLVLAVSAATAAFLAVVGLIEGGGNPARMFGTDWGAVDWRGVALMLATVGLVGLIAVPLAYLVLPRSVKRIGAAFTALAVIAPLGLIAPGFAYGEGSPEQVRQAFGYVPPGLQELSGVFTAPLAGYSVPFLGGRGAMWETALGYELSGLLGMLVVGALALVVVRLAGRGRGAEQNDEPAEVEA